MAEYADGAATVSFTTEGPTNADENHRSIIMTVSNNIRSLEVTSGYQGQVIQSKSYGNNVSAFREFLAGLQTEGFLIQRSKTTVASIQGQCPLGIKYTFASTGINGAPDNLWTTSCLSKTRTFGGSLGVIKQLFQNQIPDYNSLVSDVDL